MVIEEILRYHYFQQHERRQRPERKEEREEKPRTEEKHGSGEKKPEKEEHFGKVVVLKLVTRDDTGWVEEERLLAEVTFRVMYWKYGWQTLARDGFCVVRVFEDRIEFEREYVKVMEIRGEMRSKKFVEQSRKEIQAGIERSSHEYRASLAL